MGAFVGSYGSGAHVGVSVGDLVGASVGGTVGVFVGARVGNFVGRGVGAVGAKVGELGAPAREDR